MSMKNFRAEDMPGKAKSEAPKTSEPEADKKAPAKKTAPKKAPAAKNEANTPKNDPAAVESHTTAVTEEN